MGFSPFALLVGLYFTIAAPLSSAGKVTNPQNVPKSAILLSNVESLTFRAGKMTASRRVAPVPQLNCVGPADVCKMYDIDVMRCTNEGTDYDAENIQWACRASLPEEFKLGSTDVACEGYASSDDPYVLKGSCGVDYRLVLTDKGEAKYGKHHDFPSFDREETTSNLAKFVFLIIFVGVLLVILTRVFEACRRNPPRLGGGDTGRPPWNGGGGDGNDNDDPPPPYDSHRFNQSKKQRTYGTQSSSSSAGSSGNAGRQQNQGWRPGPWTAGLAGAGLGYALGRGQNRTETQPRQTTQRPSGGLFGGGGGAGPSNTRSSPSPPTFSSSRYESTGFGGTSRR